MLGGSGWAGAELGEAAGAGQERQLAGGLEVDAKGLLKAQSRSPRASNVSAEVDRKAAMQSRETVQELYAALARKEYRDAVRRREMLAEGLSEAEVERVVPRGLEMVEAVTMGAEGQALLLAEMLEARLQELEGAEGGEAGLQRDVLLELLQETQANLEVLPKIARARKRENQALQSRHVHMGGEAGAHHGVVDDSSDVGGDAAGSGNRGLRMCVGRGRWSGGVAGTVFAGLVGGTPCSLGRLPDSRLRGSLSGLRATSSSSFEDGGGAGAQGRGIRKTSGKDRSSGVPTESSGSQTEQVERIVGTNGTQLEACCNLLAVCRGYWQPCTDCACS